MIRNAIEGDYQGIREMLAQGVIEGTLQPRKKKDIKKTLKKGRFTVAEEDGNLVGMASVKVYDRRIAEVRSLYVAPARRGNGLAKELIEGVLERPVSVVPSGIIFAVANGSAKTFEQAGFTSTTGKRTILMKNI